MPDRMAVSWLKRDVLLFALSIGCSADELHFLYELHPNFQVFPTYPVILSFKDVTQEVIDFYSSEKHTPYTPTPFPLPTLDSTRVVDGQRTLQILKPLPTTSSGHNFAMKKRILGIYDKGNAGTVLETQHDLVEIDSGEVYAKVTVRSFYIGQGNWGGERGPSTFDINPPDRQADAVVRHQTSPETPLLYRLNGDYNPLHATPEPGQALGFGGVILHGLIAWNISCHGILREFGGSEASNLREFSARFAATVKGGDELVIEMWKMGGVDEDGWGEVRFVTRIEGRKVCLKNGRALVRMAPKHEIEGSSAVASRSSL